MNYPKIKKEVYRNYKITISYDECPDSPRDWDNLGTMICFHNRYSLGDYKIAEQYHDPKDFLYRIVDGDIYHQVLAEKEKENPDFDEEDFSFRELYDMALKTNIILPLWLYDHSGLAMSTHDFKDYDPDEWDSGIVGFVYVEHGKIRKEYGELSADTIQKAREVLELEVKTYNQFLQGDIYCFDVEDMDGGFIDSCCGFYGMDDAIADAKSSIDHIYKSEDAKKWERFQMLDFAVVEA